jgi:SAM-dependent methyltransferase
LPSYQSLSAPATNSPLANAEGISKPESHRKLNLGSGLKRLDDAVNLDITPRTQPDVVHDLNIRPWPFADKSFDEVVAYDVIEHLQDTLAVMEEIHRIAADGAVVKITLPHFSCSNAFTDPTHVHYFGWFSFHYFTGENEFPFYTQARFRRVQTKIRFAPSLVNKVVWRLANRFPKQYESRWAWLFPAWYLYFELTVIS